MVSGERILVIDDNEEIRTFLKEMILEPDGYCVLTASDGQEGLKLALNEDPDLILLDVNMPRMDGLTVLEKLRERNAQTPVILMTFYGSEELAVQAFRLGVHDYIRKPFEVNEVLRAVTRALVESRLLKERERLLHHLEQSKRQLEQRLVALTTLHAVGQSITASLELDQVLRRIVEAAVYLVHANAGAIYLLDSETGKLIRHTVYGQIPATIDLDTLSSLLQEPRIAIVGEVLCTPLLSRNNPLGMLIVAHKQTTTRTFDQEDRIRIATLANYAAIAIENARLYQAAQEIAKVEALKQTVVTLAHHINNPLTALTLSAQSIIAAIRENKPIGQAELARTASMIHNKALEITAVIQILREIASPKLTTYLGNIEMIDIEAELQRRLEEIRAQSKPPSEENPS